MPENAVIAGEGGFSFKRYASSGSKPEVCKQSQRNMQTAAKSFARSVPLNVVITGMSGLAKNCRKVIA